MHKTTAFCRIHQKKFGITINKRKGLTIREGSGEEGGAGNFSGCFPPPPPKKGFKKKKKKKTISEKKMKISGGGGTI